MPSSGWGRKKQNLRTYGSAHFAFEYPERNGVTMPLAASKRWRVTQAVSLASRWIEIDGVSDTVFT